MSRQTPSPMLIRNAFILALASLALAAHAATFYDDFSVDQAGITNGLVNQNVYSDSLLIKPNVTRTLVTYNFRNGRPATDVSRASVAGGEFRFSSDLNVTGQGYAMYSFATPIDLSTTKVFDIEVLSNDRPGGFLSLDVNSGGGYVGGKIDLPVVTTPTRLQIVHPYATTDFSHITSLYLTVGGNFAQNIRIGSIQAVQTVPEPGAYAALGVGALAVLRRRKRA